MKSLFRFILKYSAAALFVLFLPVLAPAANNGKASLAIKFAPNQNWSHCFINEGFAANKPQGAGVLNTTNWFNWNPAGSTPYTTNGLFYDLNGLTNGHPSTVTIRDTHNVEQTIYGNSIGWNNALFIYNNLILLCSANGYNSGTQLACTVTNLDDVFATNGYSVYLYMLGNGIGRGQQNILVNYSGKTTNGSVVGTQICSLFCTTNWNSFNNGLYLTNPPSYLQGMASLTQGVWTNTKTAGAWQTPGADYIIFSNCPASGAFSIIVSNTQYGQISGIEIVANLPPGAASVTGPTVTPSLNVYAGTNVTLSCTTNGGSGPFSMQWQKGPDGTTLTNVPGAAATSLLLSSVTTNNSGYYQMIYTAGAVSVTSSVVQLTVYATLPTIGAASLSPGGTVNQGTSVSVTCTTNGGAPPFSFQWQKSPNGTTYTNVSSGTALTLSLPGTLPGDSGYYQCVFSAGVLSVTSAPAQLTVNPLFGGLAIARPASAFYPGMTVELFCTNYAGLGTIGFQWQKTNSAAGGFTNIVGQTASWMVLLGAQAADAGYYQCVVTPSNGSATSAPVRLSMLTAGGPVAKISIKMNADKDYGFGAITNPVGAGVLNSTNWFNFNSSGTANLGSYYTGGVTNPSTAALYETHGFFGSVDLVDNSGIPINSTNNNMALLNTSYCYGSSDLCCSVKNLDPVFAGGFKVYIYYQGIGGVNYGGRYIVTSYAGQTTNYPVAATQMRSLYVSNTIANFTNGINWSLGTGVFIEGAYSTTQTSFGAWQNPGANYIVISNLTGGSFNLSLTNGSSYPGVAALEIVANSSGTGLTATTSAVTSSTNHAVYGAAVTITNTVSPVPPDGEYVVFLEGSTVLGLGVLNGGVATLAAPSTLALGNHTIAAVYGGDGNYLASTNTLVLNVNSAPTANDMTVSRAAGLRVLIALTDVATNWNDAESDAVSLVAVNLTSINGVTLTTNSDYILYPASAANVNDQLSYVITDAWGTTATGYINLVVAGNVTGTNSIASYTFGATNSVKAYGMPGKAYVLERSTNLVDWVGVQTNAAAGNGEINALDDFSDLGGTPPDEAFYRLKWQP